MTEFRLALSLRGAKRRGNPSPKCCKFLSASVKSACTKGYGLPRRSADWLAMTRKELLSPANQKFRFMLRISQYSVSTTEPSSPLISMANRQSCLLASI